jgi:hypothetical protein
MLIESGRTVGMETTLFNKNGKPVAYIAADGETIYLWIAGRWAIFLKGFWLERQATGLVCQQTISIFAASGSVLSKQISITDIEPGNW